jgi:hypothetical protein
MEHWLLEEELLICRSDCEAFNSVGQTGLGRDRIFERDRDGTEAT